MNKFLITLLFFSIASALQAGFPEGKDGFNIKKIEDNFRLPCKEIGDDKCIARSIGIAACTLVFGIEANKGLPESIKNSDLIFRALMKGNNLDVNSIFDENASIKDEVKEEAIKSINWCRENIKLAMPKLTNLPKEDLDEKKLEELTETFPKFYLHTLETIRRGK